MPHKYAKLCSDLKRKCVEFVTEYLEDDFKYSQQGQQYLDKHTQDDLVTSDEEVLFDDWIMCLDHFLLFGKTRQGKPVLEVIRDKARLKKAEKEILKEWQDKAFGSVFEILDMQPDSLHLLDVVAEVEYEVFLNTDGTFTEMFSRPVVSHFLHTNILPVQGIWFLSGGQSLLPPESEQIIFENIVQKSPIKAWYRNNPEKLQKAFGLQKENYDIFVKTFGSDEVVVPGANLQQKEQEYYQALAQAKNKKEAFQPPQPDQEIIEADNVGLVIDEKEGLHYFIDYGWFVDIFAKPDQKPKGWQDLVVGYLGDGTLPAFVFRRVKERYPDTFKQIMSELDVATNENFDPIKDFDELMNHYKPGWREVYPSMHPFNERFKKYYYQQDNKIGR